MDLHLREACNLLDRSAYRFSHQKIVFDRDETDSFRTTREPEGAGVPTKREVMDVLIPRGGRRPSAVGWRSFIARPFPTLALPDGAAVGVDGVISHLSRGAYPFFYCYVVRLCRVSGILNEIADSLRSGHAEKHGTYGVVEAPSASPEDHVDIEAWMLRKAAASYRDHERLLLRTALLSEDEIPSDVPSTFVGRGVGWLRAAQGPTRYLIASVPPIRREFSWWKRQQLELARCQTTPKLPKDGPTARTPAR